ncbi:chemotaxis protein CheW [Paenibacillus septentrionalis]|uniref:Chemotaxis protein CheA n=1 Tax=Paenibacillus septentrionalis TaxID=429342 RepID=A0ABW1V2F1_9BACL
MVDLSDFRDVYLEELEEQLQMLEEEILRLEGDGGSEEGINRMFRAVHTLKGSSAAMGYQMMKSLAHEMEHCLDLIRNHHTTLTRQMIDLFFSFLDRMKKLQYEIVTYNVEHSHIEDLVEKLKAVMDDPGKDLEPMTLPEHILISMSSPVIEDSPLLYIRISLVKEGVMKLARLNMIDAALLQLGEVLWRSLEPGIEKDDEHIEQEDWLLASKQSLNEIEATIAAITDVEHVEVYPVLLNDVQTKRSRSSSTDEELNAYTYEQQEKYKSNTIRVNVSRLERLMDYVGELVIEQTRIEQIQKQFIQKYGSDGLIEELTSISDHLHRVVKEIQESVMEVRMLPIEQLFNRFPRMVRDLVQALDKKVELVMEGKETELDRSLIEEIGDPMIHLIRNAIDHGIEAPDIRRSLGKPETGLLHIAGSHEDSSVLITVKDDGGGIDTDRLRQKAVEKELLTYEEAEALSDHEAIQLIFHPGFSTANRLSDVSGRGVGMDIVRTDIERLNGMIDIETEKGKGTTFKIKLPLTLAIITGLLVKIGKWTFVLPMSNVAEIVRLKQEKVKKVKGIPVIYLRDQIIPLLWLHDHFNIARSNATEGFLHVVIIGRAEKKLAIVVDELKGNQEIVIKSLGSFIGKMDGITGATILGDGSVALILEIGSMFQPMNNSVITI